MFYVEKSSFEYTIRSQLSYLIVTTSDSDGEESWFSVFRFVFLSEFEYAKRIQYNSQLDPIQKREEVIQYTQTVTEKPD